MLPEAPPDTVPLIEPEEPNVNVSPPLAPPVRLFIPVKVVAVEVTVIVPPSADVTVHVEPAAAPVSVSAVALPVIVSILVKVISPDPVFTVPALSALTSHAVVATDGPTISSVPPLPPLIEVSK